MTAVSSPSVNKKKGKIVIFLGLSMGILIFILNILQIFFISDQTRKTVSNLYATNCEQITSAYSLAMANKVNEYLNQMRFYSDADVVKTGNTQEITTWLREHTSSRRVYFDYIEYSDASGTAYTDNGATEDIRSTEFFKAIMVDGKTEYVDNPSVSSIDKTPVIHITRAATINGKIIGLFSATVKLYIIQNMVTYIKLGETGYAWLIAGDGTLLAYKNNEDVMKTNLLKVSDKNLTDVVSRMVKGGIGTGWVDDIFIAYTPVANTPWSFAFSVADSQVNETGNNLRYMMMIAGFIIAILVITMSCLLMAKTLQPLSLVEKSIHQIASGNADLTRRINISVNNEIGSVVAGFNSFTEKLQSIIVEIKKSQETLSFAGNDLNESTTDTAASITEIIANIESISSHITKQASGVEETAGAVNEIASNIQSLEKMILVQASGVSQASAAVEQMIGNINSVNASVTKMAESFTTLEASAREGAQKQQDVNERIEQIEHESAMLQEANTAIANIASQTNLLAMNAAIEAAHAGESGKGFSVVSDEIRKLSETSTVQSKTIGNQLNKIKDSINSVVTASEASTKVFNVVAEGIVSTDQLVRQIKGAMQEQSEGSLQISKALNSMNDSTSEVKTASAEMSEGNKAILEEVQNLQNATLSMRESMSEMKIGAEKINTTGAALSEISDKMKNSIQQIAGQIDQFKV